MSVLKRSRFAQVAAALSIVFLVTSGCGRRSSASSSAATGDASSSSEMASEASSSPASVSNESSDASSADVSIDDVTSGSDSVVVEESKPAEEPGISPEFQAAMDSYEAFFDEYVDFMKRYQENPTDMSLLSEMGDMISREADMLKELDAWEHEDLNTAETAYYLEVHARIYKKLSEIL